MTDLFDEKEMGGFPLKGASSTCCQLSEGSRVQKADISRSED